MTKLSRKKSIETLTHKEAKRVNIPTAEHESVLHVEQKTPIRVAYERRNRDLDPQLVWRGKDEQAWSDLVVQAPPLYIQEKVHPKVLIDDLARRSEKVRQLKQQAEAPTLFADLYEAFNGLDEEAKTDFYKHDQNWSNRMILGDSLQVMASLAEREGLRGKVKCIYLDPPYGIKFNSNFQWSTTTNTVVDGNIEHITREPEQVKAFRDTWRDGIHSYLTYLRDRLFVCRELLHESGSIFVQISNENVHLIRSLLDEVFGAENAIATIVWKKGAPRSRTIKNAFNYLLWYAVDLDQCKPQKVFRAREANEGSTEDPRKLALWGELLDYTVRTLTTDEKRAPWLVPEGTRIFRIQDLEGTGERFGFEIAGKEFWPRKGRRWRGDPEQFSRLRKANRISITDQGGLGFKFYVIEDSPVIEFTNIWDDTAGNVPDMLYVVQTNAKIISRCLLMATNPGDLVLDPTCGAGTTAYVAEQWGRRWITIDTSRVALALARSRVMGSRYPYYLLADSEDGQKKEAEVSHTVPSTMPTYGDLRRGFVYERAPHITLKSIANNAEIDVIYDTWQETLEPLRENLNAELDTQLQDWEIPREPVTPWCAEDQKIFHTILTERGKGDNADLSAIHKGLALLNRNLGRDYAVDTLPEKPADAWPEEARSIHTEWWNARISRQEAIDASIEAKAESNFLYDKPYEDKTRVRVAGPFTVESLSPHRTLGVDENDDLIDPMKDPERGEEKDFVSMILENLHAAGVQQAHKEDKIAFTSGPTPWLGHYVCAEARYEEAGTEKRAGIFVGPEFGTVSRPELVAATREAGDAGFDVLIACAFNYDALSSEFNRLGRIPVLKARMNADLHMAEDLKNTGKGNLFVIFGEPDIEIIEEENGQIRVKVKGVDVFHPNTGEVRSDGAEGIACWFIDTDYNEESFFVRHAYFLGQNDPYKALKTSLKAEINEEAWATLHSDTSRPFDKPESGSIAVKVINHLGDEVMKVFRVA